MDVSVVLKRKLTSGSYCRALEQQVDKQRYLGCDLHLHPVTIFPPIFSSLAVESVLCSYPLLSHLQPVVSMFSVFCPAIFSCAQIIVMETSSDFSRQFVVIWTSEFIYWSIVLYCRHDVQSFFVFALASGNVIDIEFYYLLLLAHSPIWKNLYYVVSEDSKCS